MNYEAPWWLPGGNLQTIWAAVGARRGPGTPMRWMRQRWDTPDGDFIDVDFAGAAASMPTPESTPLPHEAPLNVIPAGLGAPLANSPCVPHQGQRPLLVVFHGLEGSSASHYAQAFAATAAEHGWACAVPHFRGCGGALNQAPRAYHSGDYEEIGWMLERLATHHGANAPMLAVGVSLGGNALLRWAQEAGALAAQRLRAVAAVSAPLDLAAGARAIDTGFNRRVYARMFLASMQPKAAAKLAQHPGLFDGAAVRRAATIEAFDDAFTAPLHGFKDAADYWRRCSAGPRMGQIQQLPTLVVNALNDPFVPAASLPVLGQTQPGGCVTWWRPATGGHVGFVGGHLPPGHVRAMPRAVCGWLGRHLA